MSTDRPSATPAEDSRPTDQLRGPAPRLPAVDHLPAADRIPAILDHQRAGWDDGVPVRARRYLEEYEDLRDDLLAGAAIIFQEYFRQAREHPCIPFTDYLRDFPRHADALRELFLADRLAEAMVPVSTATAPATPPRRIGDYQLEEELGRGGMGVVWKARQVSLGRIVAIKLIRDGALASPAAVERLRKEARAAAQLQHLNIVAVHEVGEEAGQHFIAMECVEGRTLADLVGENPLPAKEAARLVEAISWAVQHAHERGVVHRDLKPANVLLATSVRARSVSDELGRPVTDAPGSDVVPKITDFGLARQLEAGQSLTATGEVLGTPSYMPPEQARGEHAKVGPASDVYALGATLYELLTKRPPFSAATPVETLLDVLDREPVPPRALNRSVPVDLETICLKCLQKDTASRYATAADLADDLRRFQRGEPVRARPVGRLTRAWRWCRRNRVVASLLLVVTLVAAGLGVVTARLFAANRETTTQRDLAQANLAKAQDAVDFIGKRIGEIRLAHVPQVEEVRREVLEYALAFHEGFLEERGGEPAVRLEAAKAWLRVADIRAKLGRNGPAEVAIRRAIQIVEQLSPETANEAEYLRVGIRCYHSLASLFLKAGRGGEYDSVEPILDRLFESFARQHRLDPDDRQALAAFHLKKTTFRSPREGQELSQGAVGLLEALTKEAPDNRAYTEQLAEAYNTLAIQLKRLNRFDEARDAYEASCHAYELVSKRFPGNPSPQAGQMVARRNMARMFREQKKYEAAEQAMAKAEAISVKITRDFPSVPEYHSQLAELHFGRFLLRVDQKRPEEALPFLDKAVVCIRRALEPDPKNYAYRQKLCGYCYHIADHHLAKGEYEPAARAAGEMVEVFSGRAMDVYCAAGLFARCASAAEKDARLPADKRAELARRYDKEAFRALDQLHPTRRIPRRDIRSLPEVAPLERYEEFRKHFEADKADPKK